MTATPDASLLTLGPNDVLSFGVYGQPEISSPPEGVLVSLEGDLMVPLVGPVPVEGLSQREAHERITAALARFYKDPVLTLNVIERGSKRFHLLGEFHQPGSFPMDLPLTALEAMAFGGGLQDGARRDRVALIRPQADGLEVHFFDHATPDEGSLVQVLPGDVIFVGQTGAGRFSDQVVPFLQGLGFATSQIASLIIVSDR
jgi:polysaccharide export outer membrane protein